MVHSSAAATVVLLIAAQVGGRKRGVHGAVPAARTEVALGVRGDGVVELEHRTLHLMLRSLRTCQHPVSRAAHRITCARRALLQRCPGARNAPAGRLWKHGGPAGSHGQRHGRTHAGCGVPEGGPHARPCHALPASCRPAHTPACPPPAPGIRRPVCKDVYVRLSEVPKTQ